MDFEYPQFHDSLDDIAPACASHTIVGHEQARELMLASAQAGRHALILDGERGIGKATSAFHLANMLLGGRVDTASQTYRQIAQNVHPNLLYLTRPLNKEGKAFQTVITIEEARRLQRFLGLTASNGDRRIIIIDSINDMNRNAANAVLKLLEEPPSNTLFLLISHGLGGLLPTIRSRCQVVRFSPLSNGQLRAVLEHVGSALLDLNEISALTPVSGGSVRNALLMGRYGGLELQAGLEAFLNAPQYSTTNAHQLADVAATKGSDIHRDLLRQMLFDRLARDARRFIENGDDHKADKIAQLDSELKERARVADGFNLDRRQEFLVVAAKVHHLLHTA
ncbi:MAG: DNA polymerase III subunit delta' [Ahrensia sp.]|nr:DNA polymerase III subunit delta' [Ahrensia sp.]